MKEFKGKVAVITGAASGIGRAIAERCIQEGMKVVLADVEEAALIQAEEDLKSISENVLAIRTDVSKAKDLEVLSSKTLDVFGSVHVLVNNAGVGGVIGSIWESTLADWKWVIDVNLWGVIHGIRVFVPIMLAQDTECHIVNTASLAGLLPFHPGAPYQVTKHGVVALSENLYYSLAFRESKIKVSVLCPGWVKTRILDLERNRPTELRNETTADPPSPEVKAVLARMNQSLEAGMTPEEIAEHVFSAMRKEKFYIFTHPECTPAIQTRMEDILAGRNPTIPSLPPEQES